MKAIFTGSFDPVTIGHVDVIKRASNLFDTVYAVIFINPDKQYLFSLEKRLELLKNAVSDTGNVIVDCSDGLVVDYCKEHGIDVIVRGVRNETDYLYEQNMAEINMRLGGIDTIFFPASENLKNVSSTAERMKYLQKS